MPEQAIFPSSRRALFGALLVGILLFGAACGSDDGGKAASSTSTTFTFSGADSAAFCGDLQSFGAKYADVVAPTTTPDQLRTLWAELTAAIATLEGEAPPEIHEAVTILRARIEGVTPAFDAAGYVLANVPQADRDRFQDPAAQDASDKISAYGAQVCEPQTDK